MAEKIGAEAQRLKECRDSKNSWKKWGPYLSERQWGTVREDYSANGDAWNYFSHDQARSRAYRWGEDGLAGVCDDHQLLCFAVALWNGKDPIIKERLFGLTNSEGNHGEDVKEYYFYLDSTPTHSYMKYLYKYPQNAYPYADLVDTNRQRSRIEFEYELIDTGIFAQDRYFDVFVEYAKRSPEDMLIKISVVNRGPETAELELLPTLWFRNTWSWFDGGTRPVIQDLGQGKCSVALARHTDPYFLEWLPDHYLFCDRSVPLLFTENETNSSRLFGAPNFGPHTKDGINNFIVHGHREAVNPEGKGSKMSAHYHLVIGPGETQTVKLRMSVADMTEPFGEFDEIFASRLAEADEFYASITPAILRSNDDRFNVMRQGLAGMLWTKEYFYYDLYKWLCEHDVDPWSGVEARLQARNSAWFHMFNDDIISMPDKWEYPWYAAWDLAFHMIPLNIVDPDFAKQQLDLMLRNDYLHPNGQIPAYEWNFGDVNPPVHAFATYQTYIFDKERNQGQGDVEFLKYAFSKLLVNFTWWVNRKDPRGQNVFEGGFLGLDNIGVFDRSAPLPGGGQLEQADGTAWMVFFSQQMLNIALELAQHDPLYEEFAQKFFEHTMWISGAMDRIGEHQDELWDEADGFFYDVLRLPGGQAMRLKVRSMVGLLPLAATVVLEKETWDRLPNFVKKVQGFVLRHRELTSNLHLPTLPGHRGRRLLSVVTESKLRRILARLFDEKEFLSNYGIRSLSRYHLEHPFVFHLGGQEFRVDYQPGESNNGMFGGNSNWRGPIWMPVNYLLLRALLGYYSYYGNDFRIEYPTGSGVELTLFEIAQDITGRLISIFTRDKNGRRPVYGGTEKFQTDPHWRDLILFYEYFHGDNGAGLGASHQTGWTGLISRILQVNAVMTSELLLSASATRQLARLTQE